MIPYNEIILRLVLSAFIGGLIGIEREANNRPAGLRTHVLVTIGASLIMLISIDGFNNLEFSYNNDPARLAAQVVSGIGFLGAGTILRTGNTINGLTTAASLWVCAGIGLAIGCGYYVGALTVTIIVLFTLEVLIIIQKKFFNTRNNVLILQCHERIGLINDLDRIFERHNISILSIRIVRNEDDLTDGLIKNPQDKIIELQLLLKTPKHLNFDIFLKEIEITKSVLKCFWQEKILD